MPKVLGPPIRMPTRRSSGLVVVACKIVVLVFVQLVALEGKEGAGADAGDICRVCAQELVQQQNLDIKDLHCTRGAASR